MTGYGPLPDGRDKFLEWGFVVFTAFLFGAVMVFTGLDAQVEYALTEPGSFTGLSTVSSDSEIDKVVLNQRELDGVSFTSQNRIGMNPAGSEIGFCGGIGDDGDVFDLRLAEGFDEVSFDSVQFSCVKPYNFIGHTQPGSSELSAEDKDFTGEIRPDVTCIVSSELTVSPVSRRVGGVDCWFVTSENGFEEIPVYIS